MTSKTVVILPGSNWQIPLVKKSKEMGYHTLVVNPYDNSPAFPYADDHLQSDIFDVDRLVEYCKNKNADAVLSDECDIAMPLLAKLGHTLSLHTLDTESAHLFTDKYAMCEFGRANGIPVPEYGLCHTLDEAERFFDMTNGNIVIKPLDSNSSRGVFTVHDKQELQEHFEETMTFSKIQKAVLAERYINGTEFTIDGIKTPERHFTLAISEKKHYSHNPNIACELYFSHTHPKYDYHILAEQNDYLINVSPLEFGLTHAEYKYENGHFYLIEVSARGGGNLISSHIVPFMSGKDNYHYLLKCSLGEITSPDFTISPDLGNRCAVLRFFDVPKDGGIVEKIDGIQILEDDPNIIAHQLNFKIGDYIENATTDANRIGFYIACCDSRTELNCLITKLQKEFKIVCKQ